MYHKIQDGTSTACVRGHPVPGFWGSHTFGGLKWTECQLELDDEKEGVLRIEF